MATATTTKKTTSKSSRSRPKPAASKTPAAKAQTNPSEARASTGWVDNNVVQNLGNAPIQGHFVKVTAGEHAGRFGVYTDNGEIDATTGVPKTIVVQARDERQGERLVVNYADAERTTAY